MSARGALSIVMLAIIGLGLGACGSSSGGEADFTGSGYPGVDAANTRDAKSQINASNVSTLGLAWTAKAQGTSTFGSYASTPVIDKGVIYIQDLASNVQALSLDSGEVLWTKKYSEIDEGPNGVAVADGRVFGATASRAFALDQKTGKQIWSVPLTHGPHEGIDMAPGYHSGMVYVSTVPINTSVSYRGGVVGTLWALDAKTGKKVWHFNTVPTDLWGNKKLNSGGGLWYQPAFDEKGFMYFGTGNPGPITGGTTDSAPWGASRPGPNLYTDSLIKMNAKTGKLVWYYQVTPHDIYDWDFQGPPILMEAGGKPIVVAAGKSGFVIAFDRETGKVLWQRSVGIHNGHDGDNIYAMHGEFDKLKVPVTVYPGRFGGVIAPMSTNGTDVFVPVVNEPITYASQENEQENLKHFAGELVALDARTGKVQWSEELSNPAYGATTVVNDLVFATTAEGAVSAFDAKTGQVLWREKLPAGTNSGVIPNGEFLIAPAGFATVAGQTPKIVAYKLGG